MNKPSVPFVRIERDFAGETIVCLGTGPSLTQADVDFCRGRARVIAVNDAYKLAPWADILYAADAKWWNWHKGAPTFPGRKITIQPQGQAWPGLVMLRNTGREGLELNPTGLRTGLTSGYQSVGLAYHLGAARIILLGFDLRGTHFFGKHPDGTVPPFAGAIKAFESLAPALTLAGVSIVNASRETAITAVPRGTLTEALQAVAA